MKNGIVQIFCALILLVSGCQKAKTHWKVAIDPYWQGANFGQMVPSINGFVEDLLIEIANAEDVEFTKVLVESQNQLEDLRAKKVDLILSTLPMYSFNLARYDFSKTILESGFVLIVPKDSRKIHIQDLKNQTIGMLEGDEAFDFVEENLSLTRKNFLTKKEMLEALSQNEISACVMNEVVATRMIQDLYPGQFAEISIPEAKRGLHFIIEKNGNLEALETFDRALQRCEKKNILLKLREKWGV